MPSRLWSLFVGTAITVAATRTCSVHETVEYSDIKTYQEIFNITDADGCCNACAQDAQCDSWKVCNHSFGLSCRLLPSGISNQSRTKERCVSGQPDTARSPARAPATVFIPPSACDPRDYGAKADGSTVDTKAINAAIADCSIVWLGGGAFMSGSVHLKSGLTLTIAEGASLIATSDKSQYDEAEPNKWDKYQDFGHSHFHNSFIWGDGLTDITINGGGTIDGNGHLATGGEDLQTPNKMISLKRCSNVRLEGLSLKQGGWFTLLANDIDGLYIQDMQVKAVRDGFDIISSRHVRVDRVEVEGGGDDAVVFKSDYATGKPLQSYDIVVANSRLGCGCNALQFGSETVGNITDVLWENITVTEAGKAGIGIVSMDGSHISNVTYRNISMFQVTTPVYIYLGARSRRPEPGPQVGSISGITIERISAVDIQGKRGNWTASLDGQPIDSTAGVHSLHSVGPNILITNARFIYKGGGQADDAGIQPPHPFDKYAPRYLGVRPSYGWFLRNVKGISLRDVIVAYEKEDNRPAVMVDGDCAGVSFDGLEASRGRNAPDYDLGMRNGCRGVEVRSSPGIVSKQLDLAVEFV